MKTNTASFSDLRAVLRLLCAGLEGAEGIPTSGAVVEESAVPKPFRTLLVHRRHMTTTLREYYGEELSLHVLQHGLSETWYRRVILLTLAGSGIVVELGVVAMDLTRLSPAVQEEIQARRRPLGDILCTANVLREIVPRWYLRFPGSGTELAPWGVSCEHDVYGRIGVIHCNGHPAIELLEIVTGAARTAG